MKFNMGLGIALISFQLSCSQTYNLDEREKVTDKRNKSLDATTESFNVDAGFEFETLEDSPFELQLLTNEKKPVETIKFKEKPQLGKLIFDTESMKWVYLPNKNVFGEDKFSLEIEDEDGNKSTHLVTGNIIAVNDAPITKNLLLKLPEDSTIEFPLPADDVEGQSLLTNISVLPENGQVEIIEDGNFKVRYTPNANFAGIDTVKLMVSDGELQSLSDIKFEILAVNDGITAKDGLYEVNAGAALSGKFDWTSPDNEDLPVTIEIVQNFQNGTLIIDSNQENFQYTANSNFSGDDTLKFRVIRGKIVSNEATITVSVKRVNNPPSPYPPGQDYIVITCPRHGPCFRQVTGNDPEADKVYYKLATQPNYGSITNWNEHTGEFTYYPPENYNYEKDYFRFWLEDCYGNKSYEYHVVIKFEDEWNLIEDSFEREIVTSNESDFHWRFLIDDNGKGIEQASPECKDHICAKIFKNGENNIGPMGFEDRSLFFYGREGQSIHDIFLISKAFDLSQYSYVDVSFMYLIMDIGDNDSRYNSYTDEYLKAEVCLYGEYECGLSPLDPNKLKSDRWTTIFQNDPYTSNNGLNGRNHSAQDWQFASTRVDLAQLERSCPYCNRNNFVFRFNSRLQDGFVKNNVCNKIEDAVAVDKVIIKAGVENDGCSGHSCPDDCPWGGCPDDDGCPGHSCPDDCPWGGGCPDGDGCPRHSCPDDCPWGGCPDDDGCPGHSCPDDCPWDGCPDNDCPNNGCNGGHY